MTDPTDRFRPAGGDDPLERELRRSLAAHAGDAPDAQALTERLLAAHASTDSPATLGHLRPRTWRSWGTPLVAAACVAAIVGIVLAVVQPEHSGHGPDAVDTPSLPVPSVATSVPATPTSGAPTPGRTSTTQSVTGLVPLKNVRVVDLTFKSATSGWALASADCLSGPGRCTAVLRTIDGTTWGSFRNSTPFNVPGVSAGCPPATCVSHIRFADNNIGYAFGPKALYLSIDGGQHWKPQAGGADALETLDGNVIRVSAVDTDSPRLLTAPVGGTTWTSHSTARFPADPAAVTLSRSAQSAVLAFSRFDPSTRSGNQSGVLLRSSNDGATWKGSGDPCPFIGTGYADVLVTATTAADGSVVADCATRSPDDPSFLGGQAVTSTDGGATFGSPPQGGKLAPARFLGAASAAVQLVVPYGSTTLYRSTDQGNSWTPVAGVPASDVVFLGFEGATVGRLVTDGGRTVWTTGDAGAHWTKASL